MSELKPGEFVGVDGEVHRAHLHHSVENGDGWWWPSQTQVLPDDPDFPAAVEALKALVPEPFEWEVEPGYWPRRWNGDRVQAMGGPRGIAWSDTSVVETAAFNAGRRYEREREQTQQWVKDWEVECQRYEAALGIATSEHVALKAEVERLTKPDTHTCLTCVHWGTSMSAYPCLECGQHYDRSDLWEGEKPAS